MSKDLKHIKFIFIVVAGFFITLHQVIPHHHHYSLPCDADRQATCTVEGDHENDLPVNPENHCHTLNDLISDTKSGNQIKILASKPLIHINVFSESEFNLNSILLTFEDLYISVPKQLHLTTESPLRAPPYFT